MAQTKETTRSSLEHYKADSHGLRHPIQDELAQSGDAFSEPAAQLLKHHGVYQQDDRDQRKALRAANKELAYSCMVRVKAPGGRLTAEQYLVCDNLARDYANNDLRITSRQGVQFYGVQKDDLPGFLHSLNTRAALSTWGAAGDVVRNVMAPPVADIDRRYTALGGGLLRLCRRLSDHFLPASSSYVDIWINGERQPQVEEGLAQKEQLYGKTYLPRKFKIAIGTEFDNSVDLFANDVGLIATLDSEKRVNYEVVIGGGLGFSPVNQATFAASALPFALVSEEEVLPLVEALVKVFRDHGDRHNRSHARLKYLLHDMGLETFRSKVEGVAGRTFNPPAGRNPEPALDYLGWHSQQDPSRCYLGLWIEQGRIRDIPDGPHYKTGLRRIVQAFAPEIRFTPQHNLILANLRAEDEQVIAGLLDLYGIAAAEEISWVRRNEMACPALPYCGKAIGEAERRMPDLMAYLEAQGHGNAKVNLRVSGCANGCSRPRLAEIGIITQTKDTVHLYLGGNAAGSRLNESFMEKLPNDLLGKTLSLLLSWWKSEGKEGEAFGDWSVRIGLCTMRARIDAFLVEYSTQ